MSIVIIPAYNPDKKLIEVIQEIKNYKINKIIVVNDGSNKESNYIFNKIKEEVILLEHDKNYGKGKTYTLYVNGTSIGSIEANSVVNSNSSLNGNGGMQQNGGGMQPNKGRR